MSKGARSILLLVVGALLVAGVYWYSRKGETAASSASQPQAAKQPALTNRAAGGPASKAPSAKGATAQPTASSAAKTPSKTTATPPGAKVAGQTNVVRGTNAVAHTGGTNALSSLQARFQELRKNPSFYPAVAMGALLLGLVLIWLSGKSKKRQPSQTTAALSAGTARSKKRAHAANVQQCNVLQTGGEARQVWQFAVRSGRVSLHREQKVPSGESFPSHVGQKDWRSLWQPKLNVAWLPSDQVFLRVVHLPQADFDETLQMVELQLEKLSPMPVAQVAWTLHLLPTSMSGQQTIVLIVVARNVVEEFLGRLETEGYLADRLELPLLDQLRVIDPSENGAWIFPNTTDGAGSAIAAWAYASVLRHVELITPAPESRAESLRDQLLQTAWAGELEGWATTAPGWHLVADSAAAALWEAPLKEGLQQEVQVLPPPAAAEMAAGSAARAAQADPRSALVPPEYTARYKQQLVDRLWMRALGAVVMLYIIGVGVYLVAVQVALYRTRAVEDEVAALGPTYTNAIQLKAQYQVLKDRQELKFAALDCWRSVAELLPETLQLESINFTEGRRLVLQGTAPMGQVQQIYAFNDGLRKVQVNGQSLFDPTKGESPSYQTAPGGAALNWNFTLELKRAEVQ